MRKVLALLLSLVMTLTLLVPATWAEEKPAAGYQLPASLKGKTVILHTNDVHGAIDKYAKVAALKNECYDRGASAVVLLDAGDFSQGSTYVSLSKGATAVELMNAVGYDAVTLGNHEFDYGFPQLKANFRNIATTGMGKDVLYRGSSPINPELGRNTYVDAALKQAGVNVIMNLANSPEEAEAYEGFADTYYSGQKVIYLNLGVDFSAPEFQKGLAEGLRFFAANKGTYYVHCTEGKDRAGFVSALLECLMGATYDEVVADYMVTYYNYYGVEPGTDKYEAIANSNIIKTLQNAFGVEDLSKADLQKGAKDYMKAIGLTDAEITDLMVNLGYVAPVEPATPSKPATGDAGIVVYLGLGVMALAGGVLVAKKKEQF